MVSVKPAVEKVRKLLDDHPNMGSIVATTAQNIFNSCTTKPLMHNFLVKTMINKIVKNLTER